MGNSSCWHSLTANFKCPVLCLLTGGGLQLHGDEGGGGRYPSVFRGSLFSSINQSTMKSCEGDDGAGSVMVTGQRKCKKRALKKIPRVTFQLLCSSNNTLSCVCVSVCVSQDLHTVCVFI